MLKVKLTNGKNDKYIYVCVYIYIYIYIYIYPKAKGLICTIYKEFQQIIEEKMFNEQNT